jgi:phage-related minor tail protein
VTTHAGTAYVDILPDLKRFGPSLRQGLNKPAQDAGDAAGKTVAGGLVRTSTRELGKGGAGFTKAGRDAGKRFGVGFTKELPGVQGRVSGFFKTGLGSALGVLGGATAAAAFVSAFGKGMDALDAQTGLRVQLGTTGPESERLGKVAGSLYSRAYGDSLAGVGDAIKSVMQNGLVPEDATNAQLESITGKVLSLSAAFKTDLGGTTAAVGQLLKTGLAKNADEALDIVTRGFQQGVDKSGDFLDTINEYGTQFRKVGVSGAQMTGILTQGLRAGARDADIVADAIGEFTKRAVDGSKTTADGFAALGLSGKRMAADIAAGGPRANAALDTTLDRLRGIKDPVQQARIAVQLFGTQAEDLGAALYAIDPSQATARLGRLKGAAADVDQQLGSTARATLTAWKRSLETNVAAGMGAAITSFRTGEQSANGWLGVMQDVGVWLRRITDFAREHQTVLLSVAGGVLAAVAAYRTVMLVVTIVNAVRAAVIAWRTAQIGLNLALTANPIGLVIAAIAGLVVGLVIAYKKSETFRAIVNGAFRAVADTGKWLWNSVLKPYFRFIINGWLTVAGAIVSGAAKAFGWIPGIGPKLKTANAAFDRFRDGVNSALNGVKDKNVTVGAKVSFPKDWQDYRRGERGYAVGGAVHGPGTGTSDSVPAWLSTGEHVWTAREVKAAGGHGVMESMRRQIRGYAEGGGVNVRAVTPSQKVLDAGFAGADRAIARFAITFGKFLQKHLGEGVGKFTGRGGGNSAGLVAFGRWLQGMGYTVSEHPAFGGVTAGAHTRNSAHYRGAAIDVNSGAGTSSGEQRRLARIIGPAHAAGFKSIFMAPGHYNHAHIAYDRGGMLQPGYSVAYNGTGRPEPVLTGDQWDQMTTAATRGDTIITVERTEDTRLARQIAAEQARRDLADRLAGVY